MKRSIAALLTILVALGAAGCGLGSGNKKEFDAYRKEVCSLYDAEYTDLEGDLTLPDKLGKLLYSGRTGTGEKEKVALYVQSGTSVNGEGGQDKGYDAQYPEPFKMIVLVDRTTNKVEDYKLVKDGSRYEYFVVPKQKLDVYKGTVMDSANAYDNFKEGLVTEAVAQTEHVTVPEDSQVITGTSLLYTAATVNGTYSSQLVRNCYKAAAAYYVTIDDKN